MRCNADEHEKEDKMSTEAYEIEEVFDMFHGGGGEGSASCFHVFQPPFSWPARVMKPHLGQFQLESIGV